MRYFSFPWWQYLQFDLYSRTEVNKNTGTQTGVVPRIDPEHYPVQDDIMKATFEITAKRLQVGKTRKKVVNVP